MNPDAIKAACDKLIAEFQEPGQAPLERTDILKSRFDSLTVMELMFRFEDHFEIIIPDEKLPDLKNYGDLLDALEAELKPQSERPAAEP